MKDYKKGQLALGVLKKEKKAAARLMRYIEKEDRTAAGELKLLYEHTGNAHIVGITGLPGSGKSTLINRLIYFFKRENKSIGIITVDPSSPFTGGSILGDRIRMMDHGLDKEVFIKSIPTKGWHGGVARATSRVITVLDAMGKDIIFVETAGVGQTEVDIKKLVHTTLVVLVGGLGDYMQVIKAGIIEIADIFVINKSKKDISASELQLDLENLFSLNGKRNPKDTGWDPLIVLTEAAENIGINDLGKAIEKHRKYLLDSGKFMDYFKCKKDTDLEQLLDDHLLGIIRKKLKAKGLYSNILKIMNDSNSSSKTVEKILEEVFKPDKK